MGDPYQSLWGMRAFRDALAEWRNPFFTDRLYHPYGTTLLLQAFDIPSAVLVAPLWGLLPEVAIYNVAVLCALSLAAYGMVRLLREVTGDDTVALCGGVLYVSVPYHLAHLQAHLYYVSTGWIPLYLLYVLRVIRGVKVGRNGAIAGGFLALASLASWYHLVFAALLTLSLAAYGLVVSRNTLLSPAFVRGAMALAVTFAAIAGPLLFAMITMQLREEFVGGHDPKKFSADLYSFIYPNAVQRWAGNAAAWRTWTGNAVENATYVGWAMLFLAVLGVRRARLARAFFVVAIVAAVLSLGPFLHVGGRVSDVHLPYWYLERAVPALKMTGVPIRFGFVMYLSLTVAAAFGLVRVRAYFARYFRGAGVVAVVAAVAIAVGEYWPRPLMTWAYAVPRPMRAWADDPGHWAVLDVWDYYRPMWHATIHGKPIIDGYLSRTPKRLLDTTYRDPVLRAIVHGGEDQNVTRVDANVDFTWRGNAADAALVPGLFAATWSGTLTAPVAGAYELGIVADDAAQLVVDGQPFAATTGRCPGVPPCEAWATRTLSAGPHDLKVEFNHRSGAGEVHLAWRPPDGMREIVPQRVLRTATGSPGLDVKYQQRIVTSGLGRDAGRASLRNLSIRYVVASDRQNACIEEELALPLIYVGEDVRIFEVPDD